MANWSELKKAVAQVIKTNGNQEITGQLLQNTLNSIISNLGENKSYVGIATPITNPGAPDGNVFYLASEKGPYSNFGVSIAEGELAVISWSGESWRKDTLLETSGFATSVEMNRLIADINNAILSIREDQKYYLKGKKTSQVIEDVDATLATQALRKIPQELSPEEKTQVKENIGIPDDLNNLRNDISEYNISAINNGEKYASLSAAISALNTYLGDSPKNVGTKITYVDSNANKAKTFSYQGGNFVVEESWSDEPLGGYLRRALSFEGFTYNERTGFYEKDGVKNLTVLDAEIAHTVGARKPSIGAYDNKLMRVIVNYTQGLAPYFDNKPDCEYMFRDCINLEAVNMPRIGQHYMIRPSNAVAMFRNCKKLKGDIYIDLSAAMSSSLIFDECRALENAFVYGLKENISFKHSPLLTNASILTAITNNMASENIYIKLHHDAFVRAMADQTIIDALATEKGQNIRLVDATPTV